jgi:hypothetical protein
MPPNPLRIAQTTSEVKKQHKQNGPRLPARQLKQLERGHELDVRAARFREAEDRRKAAKKKREEREHKEKSARQQMGVGLATQLIGYSHTQAQLKSGMEAFLGVKRRKDEEQRRRDVELTKKLEAIAQTVDKEPWDDDDDDDDDDDKDNIANADGTALDLPHSSPSLPEQYVDDDLDDDTLLEAHDLIMSDSAAQPTIDTHTRPPSPPPPLPPLPRPAPATPLQSAPTMEDADFARLHGPINKIIEATLDKLPEPLIEVLSHDMSLKLPDWDPAPGLLHKLNPVGLPPHRLRLKVGSVVTLLRDLNTSSQLSKSQHLRVLRAENERLECLVLDGQLEGTKALLTRVPFPAQYRNDRSYPFQRTQFPVRVATNFITSRIPRDTSDTAFKLPSMPSHVRSSSLPKKPSPPIHTAKPQVNKNPAFKLPGLPASKKAESDCPRSAALIPSIMDGWDDFLDSGTQIARELCAEPQPAPSVSLWPVESLPPLSTQDLDFSIDDLEETPTTASATSPVAKPTRTLARTTSLPSLPKPPTSLHPHKHSHRASPLHPTPSHRQHNTERRSILPLKSKSRLQQSTEKRTLIDFATLTPSQRPLSVSDGPGLKRKSFTHSTSVRLPPKKRPSAQPTRPAAAHKPLGGPNVFSALSDFGISTQEAACFFVDDDELYSGSPPIAV